MIRPILFLLIVLGPMCPHQALSEMPGLKSSVKLFFPRGLEKASDLDVFFAVPYKYIPLSIGERAELFKAGKVVATVSPVRGVVFLDGNGKEWQINRRGSEGEMVRVSILRPRDPDGQRILRLTCDRNGWSNSVWEPIGKQQKKPNGAG